MYKYIQDTTNRLGPDVLGAGACAIDLQFDALIQFSGRFRAEIGSDMLASQIFAIFS